MMAEDPFSSTSHLVPDATQGHKQSLSVLISQTSPNPSTSTIELPTPLPLSHELFMDHSEFDPSDFLLGRRHMGLEDLRSELRAYLTTLRTSLVAVINTEYEAFIGLSLGLRQAAISSSLSTIRRPVLSIRSEVAGVKAALEEMRTGMDSVLDERKRVREAKAILRRLLEVEDAIEKMEGLLRIGEPAATSQKTRDADRVGTSPAKRLGRIAAEYSQMLYLVAKAGDLPFVHSLQPRIDRITSTLQLDLSKLLTTVLTSSDPAVTRREALTSLFSTYASLSLHASAEDLVRRVVVKPFLSRTIHREALSVPQSPALPILADEGSVPAFYILEPIVFHSPEGVTETDPQPLVELYNRILSFVSRECGLLLDVTERGPLAVVVGEGKRGFEMLANVILDETVSRLVGELGHILFAAGRPGVFHQNYTISMTFVARFESLCPTLSALQAFRSSPAYSNFHKRFQLPVYFQLRLKEIVLSVERAMEGMPVEGESVFLLGESEAVWRGIRSTWSEAVFVPGLAGRFWRLTLQLLSRYRTWLNSVAPKPSPPTSASSANLAVLSSGTPPSRSSFDGSREKIIASVPNTRPGTPGGEEPSEESLLRQLTVLVADSQLMEKRVLALFETEISKNLPYDDDDEGENAAAILQQSLSAVVSLVPTLSSQIIAILTKRCADHLKHVRAVVSQVRASTRKGQNEPSFFVANILKDLRMYMMGPGKVIEEKLRLTWATAVVEEIASRYAVILSSQHRATDSLRWLKKGRQGLSFFGRGTSAAEDPSTDDDKVKLQMQLDINALADDALSIGVDVSKSAAFEGLRLANEEAGKEAEGKK